MLALASASPGGRLSPLGALPSLSHASSRPWSRNLTSTAQQSKANPQRCWRCSIIGRVQQTLRLRRARGGPGGGCVTAVCPRERAGRLWRQVLATRTATARGTARGTAEGRRGLVWRLLDHTEPQSVSLACASSLTKPEPEPSHLASQLREDTRAAPARPMISLHMGPAVQHAAARVHVHLQ